MKFKLNETYFHDYNVFPFQKNTYTMSHKLLELAIMALQNYPELLV